MKMGKGNNKKIHIFGKNAFQLLHTNVYLNFKALVAINNKRDFLTGKKAYKIPGQLLTFFLLDLIVEIPLHCDALFLSTIEILIFTKSNK